MDFAVLFDLLVKGGPVATGAIFAFMWWLERKERREAQGALLELSNASIKALTKLESVLERFETS